MYRSNCPLVVCLFRGVRRVYTGGRSGGTSGGLWFVMLCRNLFSQKGQCLRCMCGAGGVVGNALALSINPRAAALPRASGRRVQSRGSQRAVFVVAADAARPVEDRVAAVVVLPYLHG